MKRRGCKLMVFVAHATDEPTVCHARQEITLPRTPGMQPAALYDHWGSQAQGHQPVCPPSRAEAPDAPCLQLRMALRFTKVYMVLTSKAERRDGVSGSTAWTICDSRFGIEALSAWHAAARRWIVAVGVTCVLPNRSGYRFRRGCSGCSNARSGIQGLRGV